MAFSNRPYELDGSGSVRRFFRPPTQDYRRFPKNGRAPKAAPPEVTNAESPMVIVMTDGEEVRGWIEWYDRNCLKLNREGAPNLLIQKHCIKYLFKQEELAE